MPTVTVVRVHAEIGNPPAVDPHVTSTTVAVFAVTTHGKRQHRAPDGKTSKGEKRERRGWYLTEAFSRFGINWGSTASFAWSVCIQNTDDRMESIAVGEGLGMEWRGLLLSDPENVPFLSAALTYVEAWNTSEAYQGRFNPGRQACSPLSHSKLLCGHMWDTGKA